MCHIVSPIGGLRGLLCELYAIDSSIIYTGHIVGLRVSPKILSSCCIPVLRQPSSDGLEVSRVFVSVLHGLFGGYGGNCRALPLDCWKISDLWMLSARCNRSVWCWVGNKFRLFGRRATDAISVPVLLSLLRKGMGDKPNLQSPYRTKTNLQSHYRVLQVNSERTGTYRLQSARLRSGVARLVG